MVNKSLDGDFTNAHLDDDVLQLWQEDGPLTTLNVSSSERSTAPLRLGVGSAATRSQPFVVYDEGGFVWLYDTQPRTSVGSFAIPTEVFAWTQYGFSERDQVMAVATQANEGFGSVRAVRLGYEQWQQINCATAGRDLTADEWNSLTGLAVPKTLRCLPVSSTQTQSPPPSVTTPSSAGPTPIRNQTQESFWTGSAGVQLAARGGFVNTSNRSFCSRLLHCRSLRGRGQPPHLRAATR
jgi:hypothetical protein